MIFTFLYEYIRIIIYMWILLIYNTISRKVNIEIKSEIISFYLF